MDLKKKFIAMYYNQITHSKTRGHFLPSYTKDEFLDWIYSQENIDTLIKDYLTSGMKRKKLPSVDRIDDFKGYSFDNIRLVTFGENEEKAHRMHKDGFLIFDNKNVIQYEALRGKRIGNRGKTPVYKGNYIKSFNSIMDAHRETNINFKNISSNCNKKRQHAGGFVWEFK